MADQKEHQGNAYEDSNKAPPSLGLSGAIASNLCNALSSYNNHRNHHDVVALTAASMSPEMTTTSQILPPSSDYSSFHQSLSDLVLQRFLQQQQQQGQTALEPPHLFPKLEDNTNDGRTTQLNLDLLSSALLRRRQFLLSRWHEEQMHCEGQQQILALLREHFKNQEQQSIKATLERQAAVCLLELLRTTTSSMASDQDPRDIVAGAKASTSTTPITQPLVSYSPLLQGSYQLPPGNSSTVNSLFQNNMTNSIKTSKADQRSASPQDSTMTTSNEGNKKSTTNFSSRAPVDGLESTTTSVVIPSSNNFWNPLSECGKLTTTSMSTSAQQESNHSPKRFPEILYQILSQASLPSHHHDHIISFTVSGAAFIIHRPEEFERTIIPKYFHHGKLSSFKRQLNLYGFRLMSQGVDAGAYGHKVFHRDQRQASEKIRRVNK